MNPFQLNTDLAENMKNTMERTMNSVAAMQGYWENMVNATINQTMATQQETQKIFTEWMNTVRKGQDEYRRFVESSMEPFFSAVRKPTK